MNYQQKIDLNYLSDFMTDIILPNPNSRGERRESELLAFADALKIMNRQTGFQVSSRGWCYQLENKGVISKGQFSLANRLINECRKNGFLPINFTADENSRGFDCLPDDGDENENPFSRIYFTLGCALNPRFSINKWKDEKYFIQMLVEKVDLFTLFKPICSKYEIPIANCKGWSSINQRAELIKRFKYFEDMGHIPVLLYCGDFDPFGLGISDFLIKNIKDLEKATGWNPQNLIIDRFGLNYDFIQKYNLSWIDNLETGSGKEANSNHPIVKRYVEQYGRRKVEANAIVTQPEAGRELCENVIGKYLPDIKSRYNQKRFDIDEKFRRGLEESGVKELLLQAREILNNKQW